MSILTYIVVVALIVGTTDSKRTLYYSNNEDPTPEDLFGVLGIFPSFCDSIIGSRTKRCQTPAPVQMMMGKGKGGRRTTSLMKTTTQHRQKKMELDEDITDAFNALSAEDKKRLLNAMQQDDVEMVDSIFAGGDNEHPQRRRANHDDDRNSNDDKSDDDDGKKKEKKELFPFFCQRKIGQRLVKCLTDPPVRRSPSGGAGKGRMVPTRAPVRRSPSMKRPTPAPTRGGKMGKQGKRRRRSTEVVE